MSGTLKKAPSEGDINEELRHSTPEESHPKKVTLRKTKSIASHRDISKVNLFSDNKKGSSIGGGGVRLVWRTSTSTEFENLNRILGLPPQTFQSASPKLTLPSQTDHVFSENFDPLAVQKRASTDALESIGTEDQERLTELPKRSRTKSSEYSTKDLEMVSVKSLKSKFESIAKKSDPPNVKPLGRSNTIPGSRSLQKKVESNRSRSEERRNSVKAETDLKEKENLESKKEPNKSTPEVISVEVKDEHQVKEGVEPTKLPKVKNLLHIFEDIQKNQSTQNRLNTSTKLKETFKETKETKIPEKVPAKDNLDNELQKVVSSEAKVVSEENNKTLDSVSNLRKKWESLLMVNLSVPKKKTSVPKEKDSSISVQENRTKSTEVLTLIQNKVEEKKEINEAVNISQKPEELNVETTAMQRNSALRSSVKDIALMYEFKKPDPDSRPHSAPSTPLSPKIDAFSQTITTTSTEISTTGIVKSSNINRHPSSKSLEQLKRKFSTDLEGKIEVETSNVKEKSVVSTPGIYKEMSLGTLERRSSVKNMKQKFETPQATETQKPLVRDVPFDKSVKNYDKGLTSQASSIKDGNKQEIIKEGTKIIRNKDNEASKNEPAVDQKPIKSKPDKKVLTGQIAVSKEHKPHEKVESSSNVKIEINNTAVDINKHKNNGDLSKLSSANPEESKIRKLVKDFEEAEGISNYLKVPKTESLSPSSSSSDIKDVSDLMKASDTFNYPDLHKDQKITSKPKTDINDVSTKITVTKTVENTTDISNFPPKESTKVIATKTMGNTTDVLNFTSKESTKVTATKTVGNTTDVSNVPPKESTKVTATKNVGNTTDVSNFPPKESTKVTATKTVGNTTDVSNVPSKESTKVTATKTVENTTDVSNVPSKESTKVIATKTLENTTDVSNVPPKESTKVTATKTVENTVPVSNFPSKESYKEGMKKPSPKLNPEMRSGSRELKPDELKFFKDLSGPNSLNLYESTTNKPKTLRERSSSIESSSPTSTLSSDDLGKSKSKLRSSSRQFRDLHTDELQFFGVTLNGTHLKPPRTSSEVSLRQEAVEKALRLSSLEEDSVRKE